MYRLFILSDYSKPICYNGEKPFIIFCSRNPHKRLYHKLMVLLPVFSIISGYNMFTKALIGISVIVSEAFCYCFISYSKHHWLIYSSKLVDHNCYCNDYILALLYLSFTWVFCGSVAA